MDVRITGQHEDAVTKLQKYLNEQTAAAVVRLALREFAERRGLWAQPDAPTSDHAHALTESIAQQ